MSRRTYNDLSIDIPKDWQDNSNVTLVGHDSARFAPSVVVSRDPKPDGSLADYVKDQIPRMQRTVRRYELLDERTEAIAGREALVIEHRFLTPENAVARQRQYFIPTATHVVVLSLTCAEQEVEARGDTFREIAQSFAIDGTEQG